MAATSSCLLSFSSSASLWLSSSFFFYCSGDHRDLHSFPTRRSSDLGDCGSLFLPFALAELHTAQASAPIREELGRADRKSTRLNSSHMSISYAVFCLKKKKKKKRHRASSIRRLSVHRPWP